MEDMMSCTVCMEMFNQNDRRPKVLSCGHTFCLSCLEGMNNSANKFCPEDRRAFDKLPSDMSDNFTVLRLLESMKTATKRTKFWCLECSMIANINCEQEHNICNVKNAPTEQSFLDDAKLAATKQVEFEVAKIQEVVNEHDRLLAFLTHFEECIRADVEKLESKKQEVLQSLKSALGKVESMQPKQATEMMNEITSRSTEQAKSLTTVKNTLSMSGIYSISVRSPEGILAWRKHVCFGSAVKEASEHERALQLLLYMLAQHKETTVEWKSEQQVPSVESLPESALRVMLRYLSCTDVVSFGQVCRQWRAVARKEAVWRHRQLSDSQYKISTIARVLLFAPTVKMLDVVVTAKSAPNHMMKWKETVINSFCKVRGLRVYTGCLSSWGFRLLRKHASYLEDLDLEGFSEAALGTVNTMKMLQRIVLGPNCGGTKNYCFRSRCKEESSLLYLDALAYGDVPTVRSLMNAHQFSLRTVKTSTCEAMLQEVTVRSLKELAVYSCHADPPWNIICALRDLQCMYPYTHLLCQKHSTYFCSGTHSCEKAPSLALWYRFPNTNIICQKHR